MAGRPENFWKDVRSSNSDTFLAVKGFLHGNVYELKITDYQRLWSETIALKDMCSRFEAENQGMEIEESDLVGIIGSSMLIDGTKYTLETSKDFVKAKLIIFVENYGSKVHWIFNCTLQSPENMFSVVIEPTIKSLSFLIHERDVLLHMVSDKDSQLQKLNQGSRKFSLFDAGDFEESMMKDFEHMSDHGWHSNVYSEGYQRILSYFERGTTEEEVVRAFQEEEERRLSLERRLAEEVKKANKRKKSLKF